MMNTVGRYIQQLVYTVFATITKGCVAISVENEPQKMFGDTSSDLRADLIIRDTGFFKRLAASSDIGFGESYMAGEWESTDLTKLLYILSINLNELNNAAKSLPAYLNVINYLLHWTRKNTLRNSKRNIEEHYDLGNEFYRLFLDETMMYSSAYFKSSDESLKQAQINKIDLLIEKARIRSTDHVLEIGSGWGGFAVRAAQQTGCKVTTITLSDNQFAYVTDLIAKMKLDRQVTVKLADYRTITDQFDKVVSIEMLEAVGHAYFDQFFSTLDRVLKPDGIAVIQVITIPDQRYKQYLKSSDWIRKHIFPGGHLPGLTALCDSMTRASTFTIDHLENIALHYAHTLRIWRERFIAQSEAVKQLGFSDTFIRKWEFYLALCEAGFAARQLNDLHLVLTRAGNCKLDEKGYFDERTTKN